MYVVHTRCVFLAALDGQNREESYEVAVVVVSFLSIEYPLSHLFAQVSVDR